MSATASNNEQLELKITDIGANLTDPVFTGSYRGKQHHENDFNAMLQRAAAAGVRKIIVTGGNLSDSRRAVRLCQEFSGTAGVQLYCTVGCHPTRSKEMEQRPEQYLGQLVELIEQNRGVVVAFGEMGLDFDREQFAPRDVQLRHFRSQLEAACKMQMPMFLHCRASYAEFQELLTEFKPQLPAGVVHSFDGTQSDMEALLHDYKLDIGLNGCSLRSEQGLGIAQHVPLDRLHLETDAPWCEVKPTHPGAKFVQQQLQQLGARRPERWQAGCYVKGRNEPARIVEVLRIIAAQKQLSCSAVAAAAFDNTERVYFK